VRKHVRPAPPPGRVSGTDFYVLGNGLRHGDVAVGDARHIDIGVVGETGEEKVKNALKDCSARVRGEAPLCDLSSRRAFLEIAALQETVGIGDGTLLDGERMKHPQSVEPVAEALCADFKLGGAVADQGSAKPIGQPASNGQALNSHLTFQSCETFSIGVWVHFN